MTAPGAAAATALAPRATTAPDSFLELWAERGDPPGGNCEPLCTKWNSALADEQCHKATLELNPSAAPLKAILVLALDDPSGGDLHGPAKVHLLFKVVMSCAQTLRVSSFLC